MIITDKDILRFNSKAAVRSKDECWEWLGHKDKNGYGGFRVCGKAQRAHRLSFQLHNGREPVNCVLHSCDNPGCVNPYHLREGTHADNAADKVAKNRQARGEGCGRSKLTEDEVKTIRQMYEETFLTQSKIGAMFNIGRTQVGNIVNRNFWSHV